MKFVARIKGLLERPLLISAGLAAVAVLLAHVYLRRYETQLSGGERVGLVFVTKEVSAGSNITKQALATRLVPIAFVDERDVRARDLDKVIGIAASFDLSSQQTLQWTDLTVRPDSRQVSQLIVPGKRAVAVDMSGGDTSTLQLVRPGDYVDVVATAEGSDGRLSSVVLLQYVLVVAVGDKTERSTEIAPGDKRRAQPVRSLTLSLDLDESQLVALAASHGALSIAVRNADDQRKLDDVPEMRVSNLSEARQILSERRRARPTASGPVRLTKAE